MVESTHHKDRLRWLRILAAIGLTLGVVIALHLPLTAIFLAGAHLLGLGVEWGNPAHWIGATLILMASRLAVSLGGLLWDVIQAKDPDAKA